MFKNWLLKKLRPPVSDFKTVGSAFLNKLRAPTNDFRTVGSTFLQKLKPPTQDFRTVGRAGSSLLSKLKTLPISPAPYVRKGLGVIPKVGEVYKRAMTGFVFGDVKEKGIAGIPEHIWEIERGIIKIPFQFGKTLARMTVGEKAEKGMGDIPGLGEIQSYNKKIEDKYLQSRQQGMSDNLASAVSILGVGGEMILDATILSGFIREGMKSIAKNIKVPLKSQTGAWEELGKAKTLKEAKVIRNELQSIYHPNSANAVRNRTVDVAKSKEITNAYKILEKSGIPKNPAKLSVDFKKTVDILEKQRKLKTFKLGDISKEFRTAEKPYLDVRGLLPEQAGTMPISPFQARRQPAGLSIRDIEAKPIRQSDKYLETISRPKATEIIEKGKIKPPEIMAIEKIGQAQNALDPNLIIRKAEKLSVGKKWTKREELKKSLRTDAIIKKQEGMNELYKNLEPKFKIGDVVEVEHKGLLSKTKVRIDGADFNMQQSMGQGIKTGFPSSFRFDGLFGKNLNTGERIVIYSRYKVNGEVLSETLKKNPEKILQEYIKSKQVLAKPTSAEIDLVYKAEIEKEAAKIKTIKSETQIATALKKIEAIQKSTKISPKAVKEVKPAVKIVKTNAEKILKMKKFKTEKVAEQATKAKSQIREIGKNKFKGFELPDESKFRFLQRQLQDKMNRLKLTQETIIKKGGKIEEAADAYLRQELYYGKAGNVIDKFDTDFVMPFLKKAKNKKISIDDLGEFLYAKHAPERNIQIAKINKNIPKGGSGMTDEQAKTILNKFEKQGKIKELEKLASEFYENVNKKRLKVLQESGLEKKDLIKRLEIGYKNYVPLKGKEGVDRIGAVGQGFSITGKDVRRAFGRGSRAKNPFVQSILDHQSTLIRAEKNKVSKAFLKLVEENPNPKFWEVKGLKYTPRFDKTGEIISFDPKYKFADNVLEVRIDGKVKLITIHDKVLAQSMKNIGVERSIGILYKTNSYLRAVNTIFNPEFLITNFQRDLQTALINVGGEQSAKMAANTAKNIPRAMKGIWRNIRKGDKTSDWGKIYQELKDEGGKTGFFDMKTIEEKVIQLEKNIKIYNSVKTSDKMRGVVRSIGDYVSDTNEVVEMAVRTSAYKEALVNGATKKQAASLAKNLTVNFNKKGNWGTMLNTLYLFANASIQGSARVITALKYKGVRKIVGAITVGSFAINEMNQAINEEEYKKISDFNKNSNLIFMMPSGNHLKIKLPYGFNIFKIIGDIANEAVHGEIDTIGAGKRLIVALDDAYNPLSSATLSQFISPTIADPFIQIAENKNWFGGPIKPSQPTFGAKKRESALYWGSVRPQTKAITEWLNRITGGSEIEKGFVDISPENIDHFIDFLGGGVGKFISNSLSTGIDISKGEFPELKNIPFVRKVIQEPSEYWGKTTIREIKEKSSVSELKEREIDKLKTAIKDGLEKEKIDEGEAVKIIKEVMRNQAKIKAGRVYSEIKNASPEEKKKAVMELNKLEKKEFIKLLKKAIK